MNDHDGAKGEYLAELQSLRARLASMEKLEEVNRHLLEQLRQERQFTRLVLDTDPNLIFVKDREGRFLLANKALADLYGTTVEQLLGQDSFASLPKPAEIAQYAAAEQEVLRTRQTIITDESNTRPDGRVSWFHTVKTPLVQHDGTTHVLGIATDITERKRSEEQQNNSERRFRALIENSHDAVALLDVDGTVIYASPSTTRVSGYSVQDFTGRNAFELVHPDDLPNIRNMFGQLLPRMGETMKAECRCLNQDGSWRWIECTATNLLSEPTINAIVSNYRDVTERKQLEVQLRSSEDQYRALFETNPHPTWVCDSTTFEFLAVNQAAVQRYGYTRQEFLAMTILDIRPPDDVSRLQEYVSQSASRVHAGIWRHRCKDGSIIDVNISSSGITFAERPARLVVAWDITQQRRLEEELRQAQKMEAVGRLAGGIAHDFNNLLTIITGYSEFLLGQLPVEDPSKEPLRHVQKAADRAAALTQQLLAYSRKQVLKPVVVDLNLIVADTMAMLRRLIGEDIQVVTDLHPGQMLVKVDSGQLAQALINLAVNARDAMPQGGRVAIKTQPVVLDAAYACEHGEIQPGPYALLTFRDTGNGMEDKTLEHIFEPFFTTKEVGQGTGLGLATVYGIVRQSGGHVEVESEPGQGTAFMIYLPQTQELFSSQEPEHAPEPIPRGSEVVLLVEDEDAVRGLASIILRNAGYTVLEARDPKDAIDVFENHHRIDLLLTDVVMPFMSGKELSDRLFLRQPSMKVLYVSGYNEEDVVSRSKLDPATAVLSKPFTPSVLARKVREILDHEVL